jgi:hypothetical protein
MHVHHSKAVGRGGKGEVFNSLSETRIRKRVYAGGLHWIEEVCIYMYVVPKLKWNKIIIQRTFMQWLRVSQHSMYQYWRSPSTCTSNTPVLRHSVLERTQICPRRDHLGVYLPGIAALRLTFPLRARGGHNVGRYGRARPGGQLFSPKNRRPGRLRMSERVPCRSHVKVRPFRQHQRPPHPGRSRAEHASASRPLQHPIRPSRARAPAGLDRGRGPAPSLDFQQPRTKPRVALS